MAASSNNLRKLAIVPAYNEGGMVGRVVRDIQRQEPRFDVLVVDDGSTDATAAEAEEAGAIVIRHPYNLGIGGAVQSGYKYALRNAYDVAVQVDGDGQHDPRCLPVLLDHLRSRPDLNMVTGSRFLAADGHGYRSSASRRLGIRIFGRILSAVVGRPVTDPTSGLRMTDRRGIELFARDYPHDYPEVEAVLLLHHHRLTAEELPVRMRERQSGVSSINASRSAYYMIKVSLAILVGLFLANLDPTRGTALVTPSISPPVTPSILPSVPPSVQPTPPPATPTPTPLPGVLVFGHELDPTTREVTEPDNSYVPGDVFAYSIRMEETFDTGEILVEVVRVAEDGSESVVQERSAQPVDPETPVAAFAVAADGLIFGGDGVADSGDEFGAGNFIMRVYRGEELIAEAPFSLATE